MRTFESETGGVLTQSFITSSFGALRGLRPLRLCGAPPRNAPGVEERRPIDAADEQELEGAQGAWTAPA
jgi:hypothetical protein